MEDQTDKNKETIYRNTEDDIVYSVMTKEDDTKEEVSGTQEEKKSVKFITEESTPTIDNFAAFATEVIGRLPEKRTVSYPEKDLTIIVDPIKLPKGSRLDKFEEVKDSITKAVDKAYKYRIPWLSEFHIGYKFEHYDEMTCEWRPIELTKDMMLQVLYFPTRGDAPVSFMKYIDNELSANRIRVKEYNFDIE